MLDWQGSLYPKYKHIYWISIIPSQSFLHVGYYQCATRFSALPNFHTPCKKKLFEQEELWINWMNIYIYFFLRRYIFGISSHVSSPRHHSIQSWYEINATKHERKFFFCVFCSIISMVMVFANIFRPADEVSPWWNLNGIWLITWREREKKKKEICGTIAFHWDCLMISLCRH